MSTVAVADAWDVMTHARSYRPPLSSKQAVAEFARERGRQFDPGLVDAFLGLPSLWQRT